MGFPLMTLSVLMNFWNVLMMFLSRPHRVDSSSTKPFPLYFDSLAPFDPVESYVSPVSPVSPVSSVASVEPVSSVASVEPVSSVASVEPDVSKLIRVSSTVFRRRESLCDTCHVLIDDNKSHPRCVFCKTTVYCSKMCQSEGFHSHRKECLVLVATTPDLNDGDVFPVGYQPSDLKGLSRKLTFSQMYARRFVSNDEKLTAIMSAVFSGRRSNQPLLEAQWAESKLRCRSNRDDLLTSEDLSDVPEFTYDRNVVKLTHNQLNARMFLFSDTLMMKELSRFLDERLKNGSKGHFGGNLHIVQAEWAIRAIRARLKLNGIKNW